MRVHFCISLLAMTETVRVVVSLSLSVVLLLPLQALFYLNRTHTHTHRVFYVGQHSVLAVLSCSCSRCKDMQKLNKQIFQYCITNTHSTSTSSHSLLRLSFFLTLYLSLHFHGILRDQLRMLQHNTLCPIYKIRINNKLSFKLSLSLFLTNTATSFDFFDDYVCGIVYLNLSCCA